MDIGHYTRGRATTRSRSSRSTTRASRTLHLKDKKKATNGWRQHAVGQGDTPIKEVLKAAAEENKWDIPANVEFEYQGDPLVEIPRPALQSDDLALVIDILRWRLVLRASARA